MAMFHAELSFLVEVALFAAGLVLLHFARQGSAPLLRAAAAVLIIGSVVTLICTGYYSVRYHVQGEFDSAYPHHSRAMKGGMMGHGMMGGGMMGRGAAGECPMVPGTPTPGPQGQGPPTPEGHAEHHEGPSS